VGGQRHAPAAVPPGKTRYPLYRRLGGPHGRYVQVRKISPHIVIRIPDRPASSESQHQLSYPGPHCHNDQTMDHLLFHCEKTSTQREILKHQINEERNWTEIKQELISKHKKVFCEFIDTIDFELLIQNEQ